MAIGLFSQTLSNISQAVAGRESAEPTRVGSSEGLIISVYP